MFFSLNWWLVVGRERFIGEHTTIVEDGLKLGMIIFILREVLFFLTFFWSFFHYSFSPATELGRIWPPIFLKIINPNNIPLVNTIILLRSGAVITWAHRNILRNKGGLVPLFFTIFLGLYFLFIQVLEYIISPIRIRDRIYGSIFFIATGFHGIHFNSWTHLRYEIAIWYWHFVDVVWLFLFSFVYYWGS